MSSTKQISHEEYIRLKYLDGPSGSDDKKRKKKKKSKTTAKTNNVRIIDDNIDLKNIQVKEEDDMAYALQEEKPSIAGIVDERPLHLKRKDMDTGRWRTIEPAKEISRKNL